MACKPSKKWRRRYGRKKFDQMLHQQARKRRRVRAG